MISPMATLTARESEQVAQANESGRTPVVFVHGLWLLASSWDRWAEVFEAAGFAAVAPGWPDDPETVDEAKAHPEVFAGKTVGQAADHVASVIGGLNDEAGGDRPLVRRAADADRRRPRAVRRLGRHRPRSVPRRAAAAALGAQVGVAGAAQPANRGRAVPLTYEQFRYAFANAVSEDEASELYNTYAVPASGRAALPGRDRQPQPVDRGEGRHHEPRARPAADHLRREGPHRAAGDRATRRTSGSSETRA